MRVLVLVQVLVLRVVPVLALPVLIPLVKLLPPMALVLTARLGLRLPHGVATTLMFAAGL